MLTIRCPEGSQYAELTLLLWPQSAINVPFPCLDSKKLVKVSESISIGLEMTFPRARMGDDGGGVGSDATGNFESILASHNLYKVINTYTARYNGETYVRVLLLELTRRPSG